MYVSTFAAAVLGALAGRALAQGTFEGFSTYDGFSTSDAFATPSPSGNAYSDYPWLPELLSAVAPSVTSVSPEQVCVILRGQSGTEHRTNIWHRQN